MSCRGSLRNFKVTYPEDFALAEAILTLLERFLTFTPHNRNTHGFQNRTRLRRAPARRGAPLIIGGVTIPYERGLLGHSDADVLLHAITDALFGAAALGDIGRHFSDTDAAFKGADSRVLLRECARVKAAGFTIQNVDSTVIAQAPSWRRISTGCARTSRPISGCRSIA